MIQRMNKSLIERRSAMKREDGFTLIELLVVVLILGLLAAIAIPVFLGVQNNAKKAAITSDLTNAKTAVIAYFTDNPSADAPKLKPTNTLENWGYKPSDKVTLDWGGGVAPTGAGIKFCIEGTHSELDNTKSENAKHVTSESGVKDGVCP